MRVFMRKFLAVSCLSFTLLSSSAYAAETVDINPAKLLEIHGLLSDYHLSGKSSDEITDAAIVGMIESLEDPYTAYYSDEEFEAFMNDLEGSYSGIGIVVAEVDGLLTVMEVIPSSPSDRAGIQADDVLVEIAGEPIQGKDVDDMMSKLRGIENTKVQVQLKRKDQLYVVELEREQIEIPTVTSEIFPDQIGYISMGTFSEESLASFEQQLQALKDQDIKGLILDLRYNPGGFLSTANELSSHFIEEGPIVWVKDREGRMDSLEVLEMEKETLPLVVLVNESSASASEIVASALQDYQRATIIGTQTYGKGTIQEVVPLQYEGVLKLTIDEYLSPLQHRIDQVGVTPDIEIGDPLEQLQAALYVLSGHHAIQLFPSGDVHIDQVKEVEPEKTAFYQEGQWFISARKLAALFAGELHYHPDQNEIVLQLGPDTHSFYVGTSKGLSVINGTSYISQEELSRLFPQLRFGKEQDYIKLEIHE